MSTGAWSRVPAYWTVYAVAPRPTQRDGRVLVSTGDLSIDSLASIYGTKTVLWVANRPDFERADASAG